MINKICFFTLSYSPNKKAMLDYIEKIFPDDVNIFLFVPRLCKDKYKFDRIKVVDTKCEKIDSMFELRSFCNKNEIQRLINIGQLPYEGFIMWYASIGRNRSFICYHLGNPIDSMFVDDFKTKIRSRIEGIVSYLFMGFSYKVILVSKNQYNRIKKYVWFKNKLSYLYPSIPTNLFKPLDKGKSRRKVKLSLSDKLVLFVGRIGYLKGSDILFELVRRNKDKKFTFIGEIVDRNLNEFIKKNEFKNLELIDKKNHKELIDYYNASDVFVFPSRIEGSPLAPREAMSCKIPVIVSKMPSTELIKEASWRVDINSDDFDKALKKFFELSKNERDEIGSKSRELIVRKFSDDKWKDRYIREILE